MYREIKFAVDFIFILMVSISIAIFFMEKELDFDPIAIKTLETIDFSIFGAYYILFGYKIYKTREILKYIKKHKLHLFLLVLIPVSSIGFFRIGKLFALGTDTLWCFLKD